jgi:hypothetical protein
MLPSISNTTYNVPMEWGANPHKQIISMFQHVVEYNQHMSVVLLKMSGLQLVNQQVVEEKL